MKVSLFSLTRTLLCLLAGGLISLIELGFFENAGMRSLTFLLIAALTVPAAFLYLRSRESVLVLLSYTLVLVFLLEVLGRPLDVQNLLACLAVLALLYLQAQLGESAQKTGKAPSAFASALPAVILCCVIAAFSAFQIYRLVLLPNLPESKKFALLMPRAPEHAPTPSAPEHASPAITPGGHALVEGEPGDTPSPPLKPPANPIAPQRLLLIGMATAACALAAVAAYKYLRHRSWLRKTLAAPREIQVAEFYRYVLRALAQCGQPRQEQETPLEYLRRSQAGEFLLPPAQFGVVTAAFLSSFYGGQTVSAEAYEACLALFYALPRLVREKKGLSFYCLGYLRKMY